MTSQSTQTINVLLVDDDELTRVGVRHFLGPDERFLILDEAHDGYQAIEMVTALNPDLVIMDINMPQLDGIQATWHIRSTHPETKILMLSSSQNAEEIHASLAAGADGYCLKNIMGQQLVNVVDSVMQGILWIDPTIARQVINCLPSHTPQSSPTPLPTKTSYSANLSDREYEVLEMVAHGKTNKDIADTLCLSIHTVKSHIRSLISKLAVDDRTQAAVKAIRDGIVK